MSDVKLRDISSSLFPLFMNFIEKGALPVFWSKYSIRLIGRIRKSDSAGILIKLYAFLSKLPFLSDTDAIIEYPMSPFTSFDTATRTGISTESLGFIVKSCFLSPNNVQF